MPLTRRNLDGTAARSLVERSRGASLTYEPVGISLGWRPVPDGFRDVTYSRQLGSGEEVYRKVGYALMHWEINSKAGFQVQAQHEQVRLGERVGVVLPMLGVLGVSAICEVVAIVAEGDVTGFAYGSLPGHPQCGEESHLLEHRADDSVWLTIRIVSKPAVWFTKVSGPVGRAVQKRAGKRYLDAAAWYAAAPAPTHAEP